MCPPPEQIRRRTVLGGLSGAAILAAAPAGARAAAVGPTRSRPELVAELPAPTGLGLPRDGDSLYLPDEAYRRPPRLRQQGK